MRTIRLLALVGVVLLAAGCSGEPGLPGTPVVTQTAGATTPEATTTAGPPATDTPAPSASAESSATPAATAAATDTAPAEASTTASPTVEGGALVISSTDSEKTFTVQVGQTVSVRLGGSRRWSTPVVNTGILQPLPPPMGPAAGIWNYRAAAPGQTTLISEGACLPNPGGPTCLSLVLFRVTIIVTSSGSAGSGTGLPTASAAPGGGPPSAWPPAADLAVANARADLVARTGIYPDLIQVTSVTEHDWPTPALGCPENGHTYVQVIVPGYVIVLAAGGANYVYHASRKGDVITCPTEATP